MNWEFETSLRFETSISWKFREGAQAWKQEKNTLSWLSMDKVNTLGGWKKYILHHQMPHD